MSLLNDESMLTAEQAAEYVGCSVNFIRIRARDGRLKSYRLGKLYRFKAEDLHTLIETKAPTNVDTLE